MANYPQEFAQDAACQSHTGHMTELWFLSVRPLRLNTDEWWIILVIKSRRLVRAGHVARVAEERNAYRFSAMKLEGKRTYLRSGRRWSCYDWVQRQKI